MAPPDLAAADRGSGIPQRTLFGVGPESSELVAVDQLALAYGLVQMRDCDTSVARAIARASESKLGHRQGQHDSILPFVDGDAAFRAAVTSR